MNPGIQLTFDLSSIWHSVKRNFAKMTILAITAIMITYVAYDYFVPVRYGTKVLLSVVSDNKAMLSNSNRTYAAGRRIKMYLTGDTVKVALCEKLGVKEAEFTGKLDVESLTDNNLVLVTCSDTSRETAFKLAEAVRENIPTIMERFMSVYNVEVLGENSIENLQRMSRSTAVMAVLLGMLVFFGELFFIILLQLFSDKLQNRKQVEEVLEQTLVGVIPHDRHKKKTESMLVDSGRRSLEYIESFQRIASSVIHQCKKKDAQIIMVTSCLENEGKSTTAANLALTIAQKGKKVMLIDLDFRKPALHKIMEANTVSDFGKYMLTGESDFNIISKRGKSLYCYFTKPVKERPDEILEQGSMKHFLEMAKEKVDYVILDTSPMANTRDAEVLMNLADISLLVARINLVPLPLLNDKIEILEEGTADFLGLIVNDESDDNRKKRNKSYYYQYKA